MRAKDAKFSGSRKTFDILSEVYLANINCFIMEPLVFQKKYFSKFPLDLWKIIVSLLDFRSSLSLVISCMYFYERRQHIDIRICVPRTGLNLWLAADSGIELSDEKLQKGPTVDYEVPKGTPIKAWRSIVGPDLVPDLEAGIGRFGDEHIHLVGPPIFCPSSISGLPSVFFDHGHTGVFQGESLNVKTIISVHTFEQKDRLNHASLHNYGGYNCFIFCSPDISFCRVNSINLIFLGELCNFYIFTDRYSYPFHTGSYSDPHNLASIPGTNLSSFYFLQN